MRSYPRLALAAMLTWGVWTSSSPAQDAQLQELYGRGVHAYFSKNYDQAHDFLNRAIENGSNDPRAYLFRGLASSRLGKADEAAADFKKGAEREVAASDAFYNVSQAIQRVQGEDRLAIEEARAAARLSQFQREQKMQKTRYENAQRAEQQVIRKPVVAAPGGATPAKPGDAPAPTKKADDDLFAEPKTSVAPKAAPATGGIRTVTPASDDPFGAPAKPAGKPAAPAADDPFGAPAAKPSGKPAPAADADPFGDAPPAKPGAKPAPPADADPFGDAPPAKPGAKPAAPAAADPFGDEAPPAKPAGKPAPPPPPAEKDPFGDEAPPAKPAGKPAPPPPPPAEKDPFGDEAPPAKPAGKPAPPPPPPAEKDPFGDEAPPAKPAGKPAPPPPPAEKDPFADDETPPAKPATPAKPEAPAKPAAKPAPKPVDDDPFGT